MSVVVILTARAKEDQYETLVATFKAILPDTAARVLLLETRAAMVTPESCSALCADYLYSMRPLRTLR